MTDMTPEQALGFLCSAIRCGDEFSEHCEKAAEIIRNALSPAPAVPEGWKIEKLATDMVQVMTPDGARIARAESNSDDAVEVMFFDLCCALLAAPTAGDAGDTVTMPRAVYDMLAKKAAVSRPGVDGREFWVRPESAEGDSE